MLWVNKNSYLTNFRSFLMLKTYPVFSLFGVKSWVISIMNLFNGCIIYLRVNILMVDSKNPSLHIKMLLHGKMIDEKERII